MDNKKKKLVKLKQPKLNMFAIVMIILAVTLIINSTVAWFAFSNRGDAELSLGFVKLDTNIVMTEDLTDVVPNKPIVTAASFTKSEGATDCYVRTKFEYYSESTTLTREEKNYIVILNAYDYSNKITTGKDGVYWIPSTDGYFYLLDGDGEFVKVADGDSYKFLKDEEVIEFPILLGSWLYPSYDSQLSDLHINLEFQAVQSSYLPSEEFDDIVKIFELCFPDDRKFEEVLVKFDSMGGSKVEAKIVKVGKTLEAPSDPIKEDYTFDGWYVDSEATTAFDFNTKIDRNTVLYAKWIENAIVTYNTTGGSAIKASSVTPGHSINAPENPTRSGYTFDKWYSKDGRSDDDWGNEIVFPLTITEDVTIYAKWIENAALQFETFAGSNIADVSVAPGSTVLAPTTPTLDGHNFIGWFYKDGSNDDDWGEEVVFPLTLNASMTIYAKWERVETRSFTNGLLFSENKLVGYIGTDTDVVVPASYSKTDKRIVNTVSITNDGELYGAMNQITAGMTGADIFPVTITTQARSTTIYNNAAELEAFDPMEFTYPYTLSYEYNEYIDGSEYTVTEIGDMALGNIGVYAAMMGIDFEPVLLTSISLPNTLRKLGESVFIYQLKLEKIVIPEGVTEIGSFDTMYGTMSAVLPSTLTTVSEEFGNENITEYINLSNLSREELHLGSNEYMVNSIADSKVYKYVDGDDSFLFYVDGTTTQLGLINGTGTVRTPATGVTLTSIYDESKTKILGEYTFMQYKNCVTAFDELIIDGGVKNINVVPFVYSHSIKSMTINTPLDSWFNGMVEMLLGLEVITINEVVDDVGEDVLASETGSLKFVLCASDEIAKAFTGKGTSDENIYVRQTEGYEGVTFAETETAGIADGKDAEDKTWVRTGEEGNYIYYRRFEKVKSFSDGLLFMDNQIVGYIGYDKDVIIPASYSKTGERITRTNVCNNMTEMMCAVYEMYMPMSMGYNIYPLKFIETNKTSVVNSIDEMESFDPEGFTYPLTITYEYDEFVDGTDYNVTEISTYGLANYGMYLGMMMGGSPNTYIESVTIPNSITKIGQYAFAYQTKLTSLDIPESVTEIGDEAFELCIGLNSLVLPASLQTIGSLEYISEIPSEVIYLGDTFTAEDLGLTSLKTSKNASSVYQYKDGGNTFYFYVDAETSLFGITGTGSVTTPEIGVTLTNIYDRSKTTTLSQYHLPSIKLSMPMYEELTITGGALDLGSNSIMYCYALNRITIDKPLEYIGELAFVGSTGLEALIVNYPVGRVGEDLFEMALNAHVLCATDEIAQNFRGKGLSDNLIFVKQTTGYDSLTFGEVSKAGLAYATDSKGLSWIRDVQDGLYVYYKQYETQRSFTQGLIFNDNKVIGYIGDAKKVEIPTSYTATGNKEVISKTINNVEELASFMFKMLSTANNNECPVFPITVTSIQNQVTYKDTLDLGGCLEDLTTFSFPALVTYEIPEFVDGNDNIVTEIASQAFYLLGGYWSALSGYPIYDLIEEIVIPEGVTTIGTSAIAGNVQLHKFNLPSTINQLGAAVFNSNYAMPSIILPQGLTTLDANTFENSCITEIINLSSIPNSSIDLSQAKISSSYIINSIADSRIYTYDDGNNIFYFHVFNGEFTLLSIIGEAKEVTTPSAGVTLVGLYDSNKTVTLGNYAISEQKCGFLPIENLILSDSVTAIGNNAFRESPYLKSVTLSKNITSIGENIFYYNMSLKVVHVKCNPTTVADHVFFDCDNLEYVIFDSDEVATKFIGKGINFNVMFVEQSEVDNTLAFTETATAGISSAVDGEELTWIRLGQEGDYSYYKQYVFVTNLTKGLILQENKVIGYLGDSQKVEIPATYKLTGTKKLVTEQVFDQVTLITKVYEMLYPIQYDYDCYPFKITSDQATDEYVGSVQLMNNFNPSKYSYPATITYYVQEYMEGEDYTITEIGAGGLINIGKMMFENNKMGEYERGIAELIIPEGVTILGDGALGYQNLVKVDFPSSLTSIGESAFMGARLGSVLIPSTVTSIGENVFEGATIFELINLSGIEIDTSTATVLHTLTSTDESKVYKYAGNGYTLYFINEDDGLVLYGEVNESCTNMVLPSSGVTLTNIYNANDTITLNNYKIYDKAFEGDILIKSLVVGDNCIEIGANAFKYCTNLEIVTILGDELKIGVGLFDGTSKLNYILTENWDVARRISTFSDVYVEQTSGYNNLTFTEILVPGGSIFTATDTDSKKWVRTGDVGSGYSYYKEYELVGTILEGYKVDNEGTLVGYEGSDINLDIPDTYSVAYYKYDGLYNGSYTGSLPIEFDTPNGKVLVTTGEHLLSFVLNNLNTIETFTIRCSILIAIEGDDYEFVKVQDEAFPAGVVSIRLPSGIKELDDEPFGLCEDTLKMLTLPSSLESIDTFTFSGCSALQYVLCEDDNVATLVNSKINESKLFVQQASNGNGITYTNETIGNVTIATGTDSNSKKWVRTGSAQSGYTYYMQYAAGKTLTIMDEAGTAVFEKMKVADGDVTTMPSKEYAVDGNGTSTKMIEGWYTNKACTTKFEFGNVLTENTTIYPKVLNVSSGLKYTSVTISGVSGYSVAKGTCTSATVVVPEHYLGSPVISTAGNGFYNYTNLTSILLPKTMISIGDDSFGNCSTLVLTSLPSGLTTIGAGAFYECSAIALTELPSGLTTIGNNAFYNCTNLALTSLPSGVTIIDRYAFYGCASLTLISLPSGVTNIGNNAFGNCTSLVLITLPSGVTTVGSGPFTGCTNLNYILCETNEVAARVSGKGRADTYIYEMATGGEGLTYTNKVVNGVNLAATSDSSWVRIGEEGNYTYYTQYKVSMSLTIMDEAGTAVFETIKVRDGDITTEPLREYAADSNGTTTKMIEGWYTDSAYTTKFEFGSEITENTTLYPKVLTVSSGLEFTSVRISGVSGYSIAKGSCSSTTVVVPENYLGLPVISVADSAFYQATITKIVLPNTITSIGHSAFFWCYKLESANLSDTITEIAGYGFAYCSALVLNKLPSGLTLIDEYGFSQCSNLAVSSLPSGLEYIGGYAFGFCTKLALTSLPNGLESICESAFYGCSALALTSIPSSVTHIGSRAFYQCTSLPHNEYVYYLEIDDTNTYNVVMSVSTDITTVVWPTNTKAITGGAFTNCSSLVLNALPSGLTWIGTNAFYGCTSLALTSLPSGVVQLDDAAFYQCTNLALTSLPSGIKSIGEYTFSYCSALALTSLPSGLQYIGKSAFYQCTSLALTSLPSGLQTIGESSFYLSNLVSIFIPLSVTYVGSSAFSSCSALKYILCETNTVANRVKGNCNSSSYIYVLQESGYAGGTAETAVASGSTTIYTATVDGYNWVRTSDNKYYKCIVAAS